MNERINQCNVIQDLLPNYIENLLSQDSKEYVDNHINSCNKCREILETMKRDNIIENEKSHKEQEIEINHLKIYRRKKLLSKIAVFTLIGMILILIAFLLIKYTYISYIINTSYQTGQELKELNNYSLKITTHRINYNIDQEFFFTNEYYYKDNYYKEVVNSEATHTKISNAHREYYGMIDSNQQTQISHENKKITNTTANYNFVSEGTYINRIYTYLSFYAKDYGFLMNVVANIGFDIRNERFNGKECYVLKRESKEGFYEVWILKDEKIPVREIDDTYGVQYIEKIYTFNKNNVSDEEIKVPEIKGYTIENITTNGDENFVVVLEEFNKS